jgi:putative addiction module component (TIGR02574 family)
MEFIVNAPIRELEAAALALPESERARLAEKLLASLDRDPQIEEAWAQEIRERVERYRDGEAETHPAESVLEEARERIED